MNKILIIILVVLIGALAAELFYFVKTPSNLFYTFSNQSSSVSSPPPPAPTIAPQMTVKEIMDTWNFVWMKGLTKTVYFTTTNTGKISDIEYSKDRTKTLAHDAQFAFVLTSPSDQKSTYHFYYKPEDVDKLTVVAAAGQDQEKKIKIEDLHEGDTITLIVTANIFPEEGGKIQSMKIIKAE